MQLLYPHTAIAGPSTFAGSWECDDGAIVLVYRSGVKLFEEPNTLSDPVGTWERLPERNPEITTIQLRGTVAAVADPSYGPGIPGGAEWVEDGLQLIVKGNGSISVELLLDVAESMNHSESNG